MIKVPIAAQLIEQALRTGFKTNGLMEVLDGIGPDDKLCGAEFEEGILYLFFGKTIKVQEKAVSIKTTMAVPVEAKNNDIN